MLRNLILAASAVLLATAGPVLAQSQPAPVVLPGTVNASDSETMRQRNETDDQRNADTDRARQDARDRRQTSRAPRGPSPEEILTAARAKATEGGLTCEVSEAAKYGDNLYEVSCAGGMGYLVSTATPPEVYNCLSMAVTAANAKAQDPNADLATCQLPVNQNATAQVAALARTAGVTCAIDQAAWIGRTTDGRDRFEVGCPGADGAFVEASPLGGNASNTQCFQVVKAGARCGFTTMADQVADVTTRVGASAPAGCAADQVRYMGGNANGEFYEAACAGADGYIVRFKPDGAFDRTWMCAEAGPVAGGCALTPGAPRS